MLDPGHKLMALLFLGVIALLITIALCDTALKLEHIRSASGYHEFKGYEPDSKQVR